MFNIYTIFNIIYDFFDLYLEYKKKNFGFRIHGQLLNKILTHYIHLTYNNLVTCGIYLNDYNVFNDINLKYSEHVYILFAVDNEIMSIDKCIKHIYDITEMIFLNVLNDKNHIVINDILMIHINQMLKYDDYDKENKFKNICKKINEYLEKSKSNFLLAYNVKNKNIKKMFKSM